MSHGDREKTRLLSSKAYDEDAASLASNEAYDSDAHGEAFSKEASDDQAVFEEDYEHPKLHQPSRKDGSRVGARRGEQREPPRPSRRHRERRRRNEDQSELLYEMEEGGEPSQSPSRSSSESDLRRLATTQADGAARKRYRVARLMIHLVIFLLFLVFVYGAYRATQATRYTYSAATLSNGTSNFLPTTILISLDGFRADFLELGLSPTLNDFIAEGVSPIYMLPSFPSVTFPNHYTLVTGLYPESHGIVGNTFWDPDLQDEFYYTHAASSLQSKWWGGEPLWVTAELQGVKTAIHMWPGSESHIMAIEPSFVDKFNGNEPLENKANRILGLLDLPGPDSPEAIADEPRPQLIAAYVPNVDADGHRYGPNSTETRQSVVDVDNMLSAIFLGLEQRNLTEIVNVVVVSDHGMATTDVSRLVQLEDLVDPGDIEHIDGWPLYGLWPKRAEDLGRLYNQLKAKTKNNPNLDIYLRDENMPERYHFSRNRRIAPLWIIPKSGWAIVTKPDFDVAAAKKSGLVYHPMGLHGYDFEHPLMRAIFVARGPAFPHSPGSRLDVFQNTEVYNIVCDSIGVEPRPNNGTLRLPLKPVGLHTDPHAPKVEVPDDPPTHIAAPESDGDAAHAAGSGAESELALTSSAPSFGIATAPSVPPSSSSAHTSAPPVPTRPTVEKEYDSEESQKQESKGLWRWMLDKLEAAGKKLKGFLSGNGGRSVR